MLSDRVGVGGSSGAIRSCVLWVGLGGQGYFKFPINVNVSAIVSIPSRPCPPHPPTGTFDLVVCCNGTLAGLVAATPTCGFIAPWASLVVGMAAGAAYLGCSKLMVRGEDG